MNKKNIKNKKESKRNNKRNNRDNKANDRNNKTKDEKYNKTNDNEFLKFKEEMQKNNNCIIGIIVTENEIQFGLLDYEYKIKWENINFDDEWVDDSSSEEECDDELKTINELLLSDKIIKISKNSVNDIKIIYSKMDILSIGWIDIKYLAQTINEKLPDEMDSKSILKYYLKIMNINKFLKIEQCLTSLIGSISKNNKINEEDNEFEIKEINEKAEKMRKKILEKN